MSQGTFTEPTILYVDDQQSHQALFRKAFEGGYHVVTASSGSEAIEIIKQHKIFLIIADHNMPQMTGVDLLEKATDLCPQAVQAILSAYTDDGIVQEAKRRTKARECLSKPWKWAAVRNFIEEAYKIYEAEILPEVVPDTTPDVVEAPQAQPVSWKQVFRFVDLIDGKVDSRGAKRIFLNYVEPSLRKFVAPIRRPVPELIAQAQEQALKGNFDKVQEILAAYLAQANLEEIFEENSDTVVTN